MPGSIAEIIAAVDHMVEVKDRVEMFKSQIDRQQRIKQQAQTEIDSMQSQLPGLQDALDVAKANLKALL